MQKPWRMHCWIAATHWFQVSWRMLQFSCLPSPTVIFQQPTHPLDHWVTHSQKLCLDSINHSETWRCCVAMSVGYWPDMATSCRHGFRSGTGTGSRFWSNSSSRSKTSSGSRSAFRSGLGSRSKTSSGFRSRSGTRSRPVGPNHYWDPDLDLDIGSVSGSKSWSDPDPRNHLWRTFDSAQLFTIQICKGIFEVHRSFAYFWDTYPNFCTQNYLQLAYSVHISSKASTAPAHSFNFCFVSSPTGGTDNHLCLLDLRPKVNSLILPTIQHW